MLENEKIALVDLKPDNISEVDLHRLPGMVAWFEPLLLLQLLKKVVVSDLFGQFADRRLIEAALDAVPPEVQVQRATTVPIEKNADGSVWIDYVADLGDGFDATYAIATLLAKPELQIGEHHTKRGSMLILGGDQVYPTASREDYRVRFRLPYSLAWPVSKNDANTPLFALPGNHDWYDGLVNFLALFCRPNGTAIGGWKTRQSRSYFAVKITESWWIWGIDIALVKDMDQPQADYFEAILKSMAPHSNIILCSAEPGWYSAEAQSDSYKTLSYAALIARRADIDVRIPIILSGDSHHYARYLGDGSHYITSGGGGAFLHGTLELKSKIHAKWLQSPKEELHLQNQYPSREESIKLLAGNLRFSDLNPGLTFVLAALYLLAVFSLTSLYKLDTAALTILIFVLGIWGYATYQESSGRKTFIPSLLHGGAHLAVVAGFTYAAFWIDKNLFDWLNFHWFARFVLLSIPILFIGSRISGWIFGWSLRLGCQYFDISHNDAFSAMRLYSHRHFLRMKIKDQTVSIYPIKVENIPARDGWKLSTAEKTIKGDAVFEAKMPLEPGLIEQPIIVNARQGSTTSEIKPPSDGVKSGT